MQEINLLDSYPRTRRQLGRAFVPGNSRAAREFGERYFDGTREEGYGGYYYDGRWQPIAKRLAEYYNLLPGMRVLDIGCAKAFLIFDLWASQGVEVVGIDVSHYALCRALTGVRHRMVQGSVEALPVRDGYFDLVVCINVLHNLSREGSVRALKEIERVGQRKYVQVDSWLTDGQKQNLDAWRLTVNTVFDPEGWRGLFREASYTGEYYWTLCE